MCMYIYIYICMYMSMDIYNIEIFIICISNLSKYKIFLIKLIYIYKYI